MNESVLHPLLLPSSNSAAKEEILFVPRIGFLCSRDNPIDQPTIRDVAQLLTRLPQIIESQRNDNREFVAQLLLPLLY